jgi:hypothetical protein
LSLFIDTREQDFVDRFKKRYPDAIKDTLPTGDIMEFPYIIERKKGHDALNYAQLSHELIQMCNYRDIHPDAQLHLCIYDDYNPKYYNKHNRAITQKEKNFITSLCFKTGVYYHFDKDEEAFFTRVDKILSGQQDIIYHKNPMIRELNWFENAIANIPRLSIEEAILFCVKCQYPARLNDGWIMENAFQDTIGCTQDNEPKSPEKFLKKVWFGGDR